MKQILFFALLLLVVDLSLQVVLLVNCPADYVLSESDKNGCGTHVCETPTSASGVGCGQWLCAPGKTLGYKESDNTKVYPDCCGGPICAD